MPGALQYGEVVRWILPDPIPAAASALVVGGCAPADFAGCDLVLSALDAPIARDVEPQLAASGIAVVSNSSALRMAPEVPLLVPEVNAGHLALLDFGEKFAILFLFVQFRLQVSDLLHECRIDRGVLDQGGGPGAVWRVDARTGRITLFASLRYQGQDNGGPGVGSNVGSNYAIGLRILPAGNATGRYARLGDIITANVKESTPEAPDNVKKGKVVKAVIVRTVKEQRRRDGSYIRFDRNAAVLINDQNEPLGTRVFGPVARELRERRFMKIISLAPEVL